MDFKLDPEQAAFADSVRDLATKEFAAGALARAHDPRYPWDVAKLLADNSLLGLTISEADGGSGASLMDAVIAIRELAMVDPVAADVLQAGNFGAIRTLAEYGSDSLKQRYLPSLLSGQALIGLGMSEADAGSAVTQLRTTAETQGDTVVIHGTKLWGTHSVDATVFLVYVRFGPGTDGIGSVLVDRDTPGLSFGPPEAHMSGEEWCELIFDNCRVPSENILLGPGGFKRQISGFNVERVGNASRALAVGRLALNEACRHANERHQFGRPLSEFQGLQWKIAEMAVKLDAAELLLYRAATELADNGLPSPHLTAVAKFACNTAGFEATNEAIQVMGAMGYSQQTLVEYCFRRARGWMIAGGTLEILRNRIAETVLGRRFDQRRPR
jgi:alkylation response protein AidB-like acyl-CoA dehydrogenase